MFFSGKKRQKKYSLGVNNKNNLVITLPAKKAFVQKP